MVVDILWLDDIRDPNQEHWKQWLDKRIEIVERNIVWVKNYSEFVQYIEENGLPTVICFDHDLGKPIEMMNASKGKKKARELKSKELTGYDCAKWLVEYCLDNDINHISYLIQSSNLPGKININSLLSNFNKSKI